MITGGDGDDTIDIDDSVPASVKVRANGNAGSDTLSGGPGDDVLEAGENYNGPNNGSDTLIGNGGSDVLYADPAPTSSPAGPATTCSSPRSRSVRATPTAAAPARTPSPTGAPTRTCGSSWAAPARRPAAATPTASLADNEDLEGSDGPDVLDRRQRRRTVSSVTSGADTFLGKGGNDSIEAIDGQHDKLIDCGPGNDDASKDGSRPANRSAAEDPGLSPAPAQKM